MAHSNDLYKYKNESYEDLVDIIVDLTEQLEAQDETIENLYNEIDALKDSLYDIDGDY